MFLGRATNLRVPHPPGFPVRLGGVNEPHAAFLIESRTRCHGWGRAVGNPGPSRCSRRMGYQESRYTPFPEFLLRVDIYRRVGGFL